MPTSHLRFTTDRDAAAAEIAAAGGRILLGFGPSAFVAELPESADPGALGRSSDDPQRALDESESLAVAAWRSRAARSAPKMRLGDGLAWDAPGFTAPRLATAPAPKGRSATTPTSQYLVGSVAVGLLLVSRDRGAEVMSDDQATKVIAEVQEGLGWLAGLEPRAALRFDMVIRRVTVDARPGPESGVDDEYEAYERPWRDAALARLGYDAGRAGYQRYARDLLRWRGTRWSYVAFITRYPLAHFAYAIREKLVMHGDNDGWGPDNIDRVFVHETGHIFGAADEYGACACGGSHGYLGQPNSNCVNCADGGHFAPCVMKNNTLAVCAATRRQLGWDERLFPASQLRDPDPPEAP